MGLFITIEGIDGCGKTTQSILLYRYLKKCKFDVIRTREPGGTILSEEIRKILLLPELKMHKFTELLLYIAARNQHVKEVILPALKKNKIVICERFMDATLAYQGYGRGINIEMIKNLHKLIDAPEPDLTLLLDVPVKVGLERLKSRDRFESEPFSFYEKVRNGYLKLAKIYRQRIKLINGNRKIQQINREIKK